MRKLYPPYGHQLSTEEGYVEADNEEDVLKVCLGISDNKNFIEGVRKETHEGRLKNLIHNGYRIIEE